MNDEDSKAICPHLTGATSSTSGQILPSVGFLVTLIAQNLLLVNVSFLSLFDFFSLFFVVVLATLLYLAKEGLDRFLDLKPMMED